MQLPSANFKKALAVSFAGLFFLACCGRVGAAAVDDYNHRLAQAIALIQQLQASAANADPSSRESIVITSFARVREVLPATETVTLNSEAVMVDNSWLHTELQDYEKTNRSKEQRVAALQRIEERLRAIKERLDELHPGTAADKDRDKGRLSEILRRPDFNKQPAAEGSAIGRLWERFVRWFSKLFRAPKPITPGGSQFIGQLAQIVVVAVCLGVIAFVIWKFGPRFLSNRRARKKPKREARIVLGERLEPDQTASDLLAQAEILARNGDLRGAIRKAYIAFLCELGDRKIVSLAQHKTNRDYLNSVRERASLYSSMRRLTSSFELHWYGFQPPEETDWQEFRNGYQKALQAGLG
jgi:cell division protein FtsB